MDKKYKFKQYEEELYTFWEENGYFKAKVNPDKKPFSIVLPPPNANADLHVGHALMVYEDIMVRYHKLKGYETLWLAGADHAGIETQYMYEKHLKRQGKSRFDFDRETLFENIWEFVMENRGTMENQLRKLGFALDWSKKKFTMDEDIVSIVYQTFKDLYDDGLIYRANRLVNYCTSCGTSFSDLEVEDKETEGKLYYINYPVKDSDESITVATTRPETLFGDVAVMVHPEDKRYKEMIGKTVILPLTDRELPVIADEYVDPEFGTGAVKVTPGHDFNDFEVGQRHSMEYPIILDFNGHMQKTGREDIDGLYVVKARKKIVELLEDEGYLQKIQPHEMSIGTCYRCGTTLEPLPKSQWFIDTDPLKKEAIKLVEEDKIKVYPKRFKKQLVQILENFIDWNVSRQIVWGIRIPAYRCVSTRHPELDSGSLNKKGSRIGVRDDKVNNWFVSVDKPDACQICGDCEFVQDTDTFDTWFSSAQWPFATFQTIGKSFYDYFYPTTVMETGYDILRAWVSRMIMVGYYKTKNVPFENVFLHGMVRDGKGQKMSKSKGNVINPLDMVEKYGADALRAALIFGTKEGGDVVLSEDKIVGMRNFGNKIWNIGRFIHMNRIKENEESEMRNEKLTENDMNKLEELQKEFKSVQKKYYAHFKKFQFAKAFDLTYDFLWHRFADYYIEELKEALWNGNIGASQEMEKIYLAMLQMLHPYMPFVTEAIWRQYQGEKESILNSRFE